MVDMGQEDMTVGQRLSESARCFLLLLAALAFTMHSISRICKPSGSMRLGVLLSEAGFAVGGNGARAGGILQDKRRCVREAIPPAG